VVLNHLAAILFFAGPLFYCGVWMVVDPAGLARLLEIVTRQAKTSRKIRAGVRCAGAVLMLVAIAL
jgi:hypothetical protein